MSDPIRKNEKELEQLREKLAGQEKLASLGALIAGVSHEIKNPLNLIRNFNGLSRDLNQELVRLVQNYREQLQPDFVSECERLLNEMDFNLTRTFEHSARASQLVEQILSHSAQNDGQHVELNINQLVEEYAALAYHGMRAEYASFNIKVIKELDPEIPLVQASARNIGRALLNMLTNACYELYRKKKRLGDSFAPTLSVRTRNLEDRVEITIHDNGDGIAPDVVGQIFQPFFTTKPPKEGTGLGLSICHEIIVDQHGGGISVDTRVGEYTAFVVTLPIIPSLA